MSYFYLKFCQDKGGCTWVDHAEMLGTALGFVIAVVLFLYFEKKLLNRHRGK